MIDKPNKFMTYYYDYNIWNLDYQIFNLTVSEANPIYLKASYERNSFIKSSIITNDLRKAISFKKIFNMTNILFWLKICLHIMPGLLFSENVANSFAQEETVEDKVWKKHFESFLEIFGLPHAIFLYQHSPIRYTQIYCLFSN